MSKNDVQKTAEAIQHAEAFLQVLHGVEWLKTLCSVGIDAERNAKEESRLAVHQRDVAREEYAAEKEEYEKEYAAAIHGYQHEISELQGQLNKAKEEYAKWADQTNKQRKADIEKDLQRVSAHEAQINVKKEELFHLEETITEETKRLAGRPHTASFTQTASQR